MDNSFFLRAHLRRNLFRYSDDVRNIRFDLQLRINACKNNQTIEKAKEKLDTSTDLREK